MFEKIRLWLTRDPDFVFPSEHVTAIWRPLLGKDVSDVEWDYYCQGVKTMMYKSEYDFLVQVAYNMSQEYKKDFTVADALRNIVSIVENNKSVIGGLKTVP